MSESLRRFWAWVNQKTIAPWILVVLAAVYGFAKWEATVSAQGAQVAELKQDAATKVIEIKAQVQRDNDDLRDDLIERLDDIKANQRSIDAKIDAAKVDIEHVKDDVRDLGGDLSIVCAKVSGKCRHR